jgi:hypothetical protein
MPAATVQSSALANILAPPAPAQVAALDPAFGTRFLVSIDTEEEFDWDAPITRDRHGISAVPAMGEFQHFCETRGIVPLWLVDHPIATSARAAAILKPAAQSGKAEIGLHLHPWVNPPFDEEVCQFNSFAGNLSAELEREKFIGLCAAIEQNLGVRPVIYRAGRYGAGPATAALLMEQGFLIDSSVRAGFDYSGDDGGPDYHAHPLVPYWLDGAHRLLELPVTTVFAGALRSHGRKLFPLARRVPRLPGVLARTRLLERIALTPEGIPVREALRAIDAALADRLPVLVFSFHSPSLAPGHTPYVRTSSDRERFYAWWEAVLTHLARRGIAPTTVAQIAHAAQLASRGEAG